MTANMRSESLQEFGVQPLLTALSEAALIADDPRAESIPLLCFGLV